MSQAHAETTYAQDELIAHYRLMLLIRRFEETLSDLFGRGEIPGTAHFCMGQEACAVGAVAALRPDDLVTSNHRGHGHALAKTRDPKRLMAELMGKATGFCGGRSGSQHLCCIDKGFLGSNGITGGMVPIAVGAALSQKLLGTGRIVLSFFGDGATGQGVFHEAVNMAAVWRLPVVFFCENNGYAMSLPVEKAFREPSVARRAAAHGLPTATVDGMDYFAVRQAVEDAVAQARRGDGPVLIEAFTYRFCGHSKSDECAYRSREEESCWRERDPIVLMGERLQAAGLLDADAGKRLADEVQAEVAEAVAFARSSPLPDPATVQEFLLSGSYSGD
ncbi:MAG: thiamine pyrophosphate-dependent dehydrogenase E1 component subunit alpha [Armatimonadetes bacterium]|nr:thiamine pyrophosphate-dependent dehydrogenase E1 component subunit alpha [Armatimonadota bacterium]